MNDVPQNKMFYFKYDGYGEEAHVCAPTKEAAIEALRKAIDEQIKRREEEHPKAGDFNKTYLDRLFKEMSTCSEGYTIEEYSTNGVVFTEKC